MPAPRHDFTADPNWGANNSAAAGSWDGSIEEVRGSAPATTPLGPFVYPTFVRVRVTGEVRQLPGALPGSNIVRQPYNTSDPDFWGVIGFYSGGDTWWATSSEAILRVVRPITPFRNWAGGQPRGDASHCGVPGYALCWTWAGSAHFDFVRLPVNLTLARSPDTTVWVGTAATFTAGVSQTFFPPNPHPVGLMELRWRWLPDSAGSSADSVACTGVSGPTCTRVFRRSGTMYTSAYVNGEHQQKSMHVDVKVPQLELTASSTEVTEGDPVTFVGTLSPPTDHYQVVGWSWVSDGSGPILTSRSSEHSPRLSASVVTAQRTAQPSTTSARGGQLIPPSGASRDAIAAGDTIIATVDDPVSYSDDRAAPTACQTYTLQCTMAITKPGTLTLVVNVAGEVQSRSIHVAVKYYCPPAFPVPGVPDVPDGELVVQTHERNFVGVDLGSHTVWIKGPWTKTKDLGFNEQIGMPEANYQPSSARDDVGHTILVTGMSTVIFACRVKPTLPEDPRGDWVGRMFYAGHVNLSFFVPR